MKRYDAQVENPAAVVVCLDFHALSLLTPDGIEKCIVDCRVSCQFRQPAGFEGAGLSQHVARGSVGSNHPHVGVDDQQAFAHLVKRDIEQLRRQFVPSFLRLAFCLVRPGVATQCESDEQSNNQRDPDSRHPRGHPESKPTDQCGRNQPNYD